MKTLEERLTYAREVVGRDPVATDLGIVVDSLEEGLAEVSLIPQARHLNALDRVHGTTIYALVDQAVAVAANTLPTPALVLEMKINFRRAALPGEKLTSRAKLRDRSRKISLWEVEVSNPEGNLVALAQGTGFHAD